MYARRVPLEWRSDALVLGVDTADWLAQEERGSLRRYRPAARNVKVDELDDALKIALRCAQLQSGGGGGGRAIAAECAHTHAALRVDEAAASGAA